MHANRTTRRIALTVSALLLATAISACNNHEAEDVAAMRAMMEKQEQEKQEQRRKDAEGMEEMRRAARESAKKLGVDK